MFVNKNNNKSMTSKSIALICAILVIFSSIAFGKFLFNREARIKTSSIEGGIINNDLVIDINKLNNNKYKSVNTKFINSGNSPCFMRGTYSLEIVDIEGNNLPTSVEFEDKMQDVIKVAFDNTNYTVLDDKWFYFNKTIRPDMKVDSFIESIKLADLDFNSSRLLKYKDAKVQLSFQVEFLQFSNKNMKLNSEVVSENFNVVVKVIDENNIKWSNK